MCFSSSPACMHFPWCWDKDNEACSSSKEDKDRPRSFTLPPLLWPPAFFSSQENTTYFLLPPRPCPRRKRRHAPPWCARLGQKVCVCYTSDLQTSPIFTVDYYKGVAKSAAEAGAHMIGIKVSVDLANSGGRYGVQQPALRAFPGGGRGGGALVCRVGRKNYSSPLSLPIFVCRRETCCVCPRASPLGVRRRTTAPLTC